LDFLRRYGDRELLYFRREEPHARTRHELVVLLDQGVRTWGDVRLVLAAAVLALGRQAVRGKLPFRVSVTSAAGELLDPAAVAVEPSGPWTGDVEPVGFPFRFGINWPDGIRLFDFDYNGQWLLTVGTNGLLHLWPTERQGRMEILPRALVGGRLLSRPDSLV